MKACVYAICKNEIDNVAGFIVACDSIGLPAYVLDTGSADGTVERLREFKANVFEQKIEPWRFDTARNLALSVIPASIQWCVACDLDERVELGLKSVLEAQALSGFTRVRHGYKPEGDAHPDWCVDGSRIHRRHGYKWKWPVHEDFLALPGTEEKVFETREVLISHYPKPGRKRTYTDLLRKAVMDEPFDERMNLLYARDLYNDSEIDKAFEMFEFFMTMKCSDILKRVYALCMIARCHRKRNEINKEVEVLNLAASEMPTRRETLVELADALRRGKAYEVSLKCVRDALKIKDGMNLPHSDPTAWGFKPLEIAMIAAYYSGHPGAAKNYGKEALSLARNPKDIDRIKENLEALH